MKLFDRIFGKGKSKPGASKPKASKPGAREAPKQGQNQVQEWVAALAAEDARTGQDAMDKLWRIGEPAVEPLIAALQSDKGNVQFRAARTLGDIGDARAIEPLIQLYEATENTGAALALGKFGDPHAIPTLVKLLDIQNWIGEVKKSLVAYGSAAVEPIMASLQEKQGPEYTSAKANHIAVLGAIGDPRAADVLKAQATPDKEARLREVAIEALAKLGVPIEVSPDEIAQMREALLSSDYDTRKTTLPKARLAAGSIKDAAFQRALQASEKVQVAYDTQRQARSGGPIQACQEAIQLEPRFSAAYTCLSYLQREYVRKADEALAWAKKATQIDPHSAEAWTELGKVHVALGDVVKAAGAFQRVVTVKPGHANLEPTARLVAVYRRLGMQDALGQALVRLNRAGVGLDPSQEREWERMVMAASAAQLRKAIQPTKS
ncbi:MAG: HEAT repeat domain-containing protein [Anaerolineae bacterium]|nr:HEAT repeat domain-containing protein [Anaerolineae bacterium]